MKSAILNLRALAIVLLLTLAGQLVGCDSDDGHNHPCTKQVEAVLTFWDITVWGGGIFCDGKRVTVVGQEEGSVELIADIGPETCEEPGVYVFNYTFEYAGGECEYCSSSDDKEVCVPLNNQCGDETVEITASGSEEGGIHPMVCCPDDPDCV
jgi:hypothetical protein